MRQPLGVFPVCVCMLCMASEHMGRTMIAHLVPVHFPGRSSIYSGIFCGVFTPACRLCSGCAIGPFDRPACTAGIPLSARFWCALLTVHFFALHSADLQPPWVIPCVLVGSHPHRLPPVLLDTGRLLFGFLSQLGALPLLLTVLILLVAWPPFHSPGCPIQVPWAPTVFPHARVRCLHMYWCASSHVDCCVLSLAPFLHGWLLHMCFG